MLVYGLISPHPPIIIPAVGGDDTRKVGKTITALKQASAELGATKPTRLIMISPHEGHGFEVPSYYLIPNLPADIPVEEILVTQDSYRYYFDLGRTMATKIALEPSRVAIVASGDLSHVLKADGPYGFNPAGPVLDDMIIEAVRRRDAQTLLSIDPQTLNNGAECGLRSILFLLGAIEGSNFQPRVLSYEGPFGVGYMVATFKPSNVS